MNKLKILKTSFLSTALLSIVILIATSFIMVVFPLAYFQSYARISDKDMAGYSEDIADFCAVSFSRLGNYQYQELCKIFDMDNFAGTVSYGYVEYQSNNDFNLRKCNLLFVSEKMVKELPSRGYNFSKTKPIGYREAYAPSSLKDIYQKNETYEISCYAGDYQYKQKIKILGYCENFYYNFSTAMSQSLLTNLRDDFLIFDDIPPYAKVASGLMMSDKTPDYYKSLGVYAKTIRQINIDSKTSTVYDIFIYWCICAIVLLIVVVTSNYYFSADKLIKRSGVMYIYGGKRSTIIYIEILKMLMLFILAFAIATLTIGIVITETSSYDMFTHEMLGSYLVDWKTHFICVGIMFVIYLASISFGLIKFAKFKPLKAISNNNTE